MEDNLLDNQSKTNTKEDQKASWVKARWGVILICVVHFFVSVSLMAANKETDARFTGLPIIFNYWIASWYVKDRIEKGKEEANLFLMGVKAAGVVFLIQVVLGAILISILMS